MGIWGQRSPFVKFVISIVIAFSVSLASQADRSSPLDSGLYLSFEQRVIFSYLLRAVGLPDGDKEVLIDQFTEVIEKYQSRTKKVKVNSFSEFLAAFRGPWPNSYSLESDLQLLLQMSREGQLGVQKEFIAKDKVLQKQINDYQEWQNQRLVELANSNKLLSSMMMISSSPMLLGSNDPRAVILMLATVVQQTEAQAVQQIHQIANQGKDQLAKIDMHGKGNDPVFQFVVEIMKGYFERLSLDSKKQAISYFAGANIDASSIEKFAMMVKASGPQFQKLLQVLARDGNNFSADFIEVFRKLESNNQAIPEPLVRQLFEVERSRYQWVNYNLKPLGTGTMAQVHLATIPSDEGHKQVVVRFLKPEIQKRVHEDHLILKELAPLIDANPNLVRFGFPKVTPIVEDLQQTVMDELNLSATVQRQQQAKVYQRELFFNGRGYKNFIEVRVPEVYRFSPESNLHVQELMPGSKLDKWAEQLEKVVPDFKKVMIEKMASLWVEEVLFRSGFFHSDLHQGNFLVEFTEPSIKVSILDFGMGGQISKEMQLDFLLFGAAIQLNHSEKLSEIIWKLSDRSRNQIDYQTLSQIVHDRVLLINSKKIPKQSFLQWTAWAMNSGIRFPYIFVSLNRGVGILDKSLADAKSPKTIEDIVLSFAGKYGAKSIWDLHRRGALNSKQLFDLGTSLAKEYLKNGSEPIPVVAANIVSCAKLYQH